MSEVTRLLEAAQAGDRQAAADLLPLVYDELRKLAAVKMAHEKPGHTLNATALVHEAYLRLIGDQKFDHCGHFFSAAAEAMRRILVESARRRASRKHGGDQVRVPLTDDLAANQSDADLLAVHDVLDQLADHDPPVAELVKLHVFVGLSLDQSAAVLGLSPRTVYRNWASRPFLPRKPETRPANSVELGTLLFIVVQTAPTRASPPLRQHRRKLGVRRRIP